MSDSQSPQLVFMMGEFKAEFPTDRMYAKNHMWAQPDENKSSNGWRFGFTAYAVRLLQDVYFLEWVVDGDATLGEQQEIGAIESKKAESALYAPAPGTLQGFNEQLLSDPSYINVSPYEEGWLFGMKACDSGELMKPEEYIEHLDQVWEVTQRTIKGQLN